LSEGIDGGLAPRRAAIDWLTIGDGFGVGTTTRVAALAALGLRQKIVDVDYPAVSVGGKSRPCTAD